MWIAFTRFGYAGNNGQKYLERARKCSQTYKRCFGGEQKYLLANDPGGKHALFLRHTWKETDKKEALEILDKFGLKEKANDLVQQLSRGMQQKTAVAVCLATGADILMLDEPTLGLDVASSIELRHILRNLVEKEGKTILLSTHDMNLVEAIADRVAIMNKGKIVVCERKEKLMEMFKARRYVLKISANGQNVASYLEDSGAVITKREDGLLEFSIDLENPKKLFDLMDTLKTAGTEIKSIEQDTVNFEKIFMKYVSEEVET